MNDIIIIGAGAAGLAAARDLARKGMRVTLLEARNRTGGRVYTNRENASHFPVELGAEFVHGSHPSMLKALEEGNILFCDVTARQWYFESGVLVKSHEFWNKLTALMDLMSLDRPDQTFKDFLASLPDDEASRQAKAIATRYVQGFHAARIDSIGVHGLIKANEAEDDIGGHHSFRVIGGYDSLAAEMLYEAEEAGARLRLNTIAREIHWSVNGVEVVCISEGKPETFKGSCVVITLPLAILQRSVQSQTNAGTVSKTETELVAVATGSNSSVASTESATHLKFVPELPQEKKDAIFGVEMGQAFRITLEFREYFWEKLEPLSSPDEAGNSVDFSQLGFVYHPEAPLPTWWTALPIHAPFLVGWSGGPRAEELLELTEEELLNQALQSLRMIFGVTESQLRELLVSSHTHDWSADPFARGAYSYLPVNGLKAQQDLAQPVGAAEFGKNVLYFAGEATSVGHIGTVHGAIESGERAAREIVDAGK